MWRIIQMGLFILALFAGVAIAPLPPLPGQSVSWGEFLLRLAIGTVMSVVILRLYQRVSHDNRPWQAPSFNKNPFRPSQPLAMIQFIGVLFATFGFGQLSRAVATNAPITPEGSMHIAIGISALACFYLYLRLFPQCVIK